MTYFLVLTTYTTYVVHNTYDSKNTKIQTKIKSFYTFLRYFILISKIFCNSVIPNNQLHRELKSVFLVMKIILLYLHPTRLI